jgi:hypothetical protein
LGWAGCDFVCLVFCRFLLLFIYLLARHEKTAKFVALKKSDKDRKKKERMRIKLMATSDPELKASLRRKKCEEMKRYRQRKKQQILQFSHV